MDTGGTSNKKMDTLVTADAYHVLEAAGNPNAFVR